MTMHGNPKSHQVRQEPKAALYRYIFKTGAIVARVETPQEADREAIALVALQSNIGRCDLGLLASVELEGEDEDGCLYFSTERLCKKLGRWVDQP